MIREDRHENIHNFSGAPRMFVKSTKHALTFFITIKET